MTNAAAQAQRRTIPRWLPHLLGAAAVALAAFLLHRTLSTYSIDEIYTSIASIPAARIALSVLFAAASYACLTGFDWLALRYVGKQLPYRYVALASFCSLSLGHNIGFAALSSGAIRYRFYSRCNVAIGDIAKIILFCGVTVGLGLTVLAGGTLLLSSALASEMTGLPQSLILVIGLGCIVAAGGYVALAAFVRTTLKLRKWSIQLPPWQIALAQLAIGPLNFVFVAACLHQALAGLAEVTYLQVATAYVVGLAGTLITHVPGGLGVIETVVLFLIPERELIGGLVAFRVIYFLVPLCIGAPLFARTEHASRRA
jgi:uncharacterized membrane protein YbhN (UPF0104 family)